MMPGQMISQNIMIRQEKGSRHVRRENNFMASSIEDNQETVNALMKKLKNPPDEYKDAYDAVSDLYDAYISLTNCATDPSGSLQTYSSTFNDADTNTLNAYKAMELYLDD